MRRAGQSGSLATCAVHLLLEVNDLFVKEKNDTCAVKTNHLWIFALNVMNQMPLSFGCIQVWHHSSGLTRGDKTKKWWVFSFVGGIEEALRYLLAFKACAFWKTGLLPQVDSQFPRLSRTHADGGGLGLTLTLSSGCLNNHRILIGSHISSQPLASIPSVHSGCICTEWKPN